MKINIIAMVTLLLMVGIVSAITVGQILTQEQINNADIQILDLNPSWQTRDNGNLYIDKESCSKSAPVCTAYITVGTTIEKRQDYDYENEEPIGEVYYEVVNKTIPVLFRTTKYIELYRTEGKAVAYEQLEADLRPIAIKKLKEEVERINKYKTGEIEAMQDELLEIIDGQGVEEIN